MHGNYGIHATHTMELFIVWDHSHSIFYEFRGVTSFIDPF